MGVMLRKASKRGNVKPNAAPPDQRKSKFGGLRIRHGFMPWINGVAAVNPGPGIYIQPNLFALDAPVLTQLCVCHDTQIIAHLSVEHTLSIGHVRKPEVFSFVPICNWRLEREESTVCAREHLQEYDRIA